MSFDPITTSKPLFASSAGTSGTTPPKTSAPDQETFLKLLVAQLKNQDPLQPQDGTQFVAQLAQFSALDQLININRQLGDLLGKK
jgi:flagellar basal-body rod modification protein FlgD